ncbi:MAG: DUF4489 domain-containing protein [Firmicutes bacterium]|nr:DUF4489 domain-containing protein [Bacillota bacterium]
MSMAIKKGNCNDKPQPPSHNALLLFCGQGVSALFKKPNDPPLNIGFVAVDATGLRKPLAKIKFSSIVNLSGLAANPQALLTFKLFRACEEQSPLLLNRWIYEVNRISDNNIMLRFDTSFNFIFCDRLICPRCCDYFIEASVENLVNATVFVNNVQVQALAQ